MTERVACRLPRIEPDVKAVSELVSSYDRMPVHTA